MKHYICILFTLLLFYSNVAQTTIDYETQIQPIFDNSCVACHSGNNPSGGLNLSSYENVMAGGNNGAVIQIGDYENSILWQEVSSGDMPNNWANNNMDIPDLTSQEIELIENWILDLQCMLIDCVEWAECILGECVCINDVNENGVCDENEIAGCMDEEACNYDPFANSDECYLVIGEFTPFIGECPCMMPGDTLVVFDSTIPGFVIAGIYDENCEYIEVTTSIQESNTSRKLIKVIDLLGRNIPFPNEDIILLHIYDDGTIEKVKHIK